MSGTDWTQTPNLGLFKPVYDMDAEAWGSHLNQNADKLDAALGTSGAGALFLPLAGGTMTGPLNVTATGGNTVRSVQDRFAAVADVRDYGAVCDGTTDDTTAVNNAITAVCNAGGGTITFPRGKTCLMLGAVVIPYSGTNPVQAPLRLTGGGSSPRSSLGVYGEVPIGGSRLDLRYNATGSYVAKIDTRGIGVLEIDHLILMDGGTSNALFIQTTNTALNIHDCVFQGNAANNGTACVQNAIQLGGITSASTTLGTAAATAGFQGYGTVIANNWFSRIKVAVGFGGAANAVYLSNNTTDTTCGSSDAQGAPYVIYGNGYGAVGCFWSGGIVEMSHYPYAIAILGSQTSNLNLVSGLGLYDENMGSPTLGAFYLSAAAVSNTFIPAFLDSALRPVLNGPGAASNSVMLSYDISNFNNALKVGSGTSAPYIAINGGSSGSGAGPELQLQWGGTARGGLYGYSAFFGGAYDSRTVVSGNDGLVLTTAATVRMTIDNGGVATINSGSLTVGAGAVSSTPHLNINGGSSGAGAGPTLALQWGGTTRGGLGGYSAYLGGAYDSRTLLIGADGLLLGAGSAAWISLDGGGNMGFRGVAPIAKPTVTGAKGSNAALASLMAALAAYGLVTDSTTA